MYNALRTLLLNLDGDAVVPDWVIGEQAVPVGYSSVILPTYLQQIRNVLFGAKPDRTGLNYRLAQYLTLLHSTELTEFVLALDPRVTYLNADLSTLFSPTAFTPAAVSLGGVPLAINGSPATPDFTGQLYYSFQIQTLSDNSVSVSQLAPEADSEVVSYTLQNNLSTETITLGNSGFSFFVPGPFSAPDTWSLSFNLRPQWDMGQIDLLLHQLGEPLLLQLFGAAPPEPFATFSNLFHHHPELPYRLGGALLAAAYQTNALRGGNG